MVNAARITALGPLVFLFAMAANYALDVVYQTHALILMAVALFGFIWTIRHASDPGAEPGPGPAEGYMDEVIRYGCIEPLRVSRRLFRLSPTPPRRGSPAPRRSLPRPLRVGCCRWARGGGGC